MNIDNIAPQLAQLLGVDPDTLILLIMLVGTIANLGARAIPQTATGFLGGLRKACAVIGLYIPSRIAPGVTVHDVARAAYETPPIPQQVEADKAEQRADRPAASGS